MAEVIRMPLLSDTMTEGKIVAWHKNVGDVVKADDVLADVETDKATMEVVGYVDGVLLHIGTPAGTAAAINGIIAIVGKAGEDISGLLAAENNTNNVSEVKEVVAEKSTAAKVEIPKDITVIRMPLLSDTMTEGKIVAWHKNVGDVVKSDDVLADVETDKATMEVVGYADGTLLYKGVEEGSAAKINGIIAIVGKASTDVNLFLNDLLASENSDASVAKTEETKTEVATSVAPVAVVENNEVSSSDRLKISPLARSIAKEKGLNINTLKGSGDGGRIVKRDLDNAQTTSQVASASVASATSLVPLFIAGKEGHTDIPVTQMRKIIAERLSKSMFTAPHFYLKISVQMDSLLDARKQLNMASPVKISINDMLIKACAMSLTKHPDINSSWLGDVVRQNHHIHIGTAVALPDGLIVPVIKFANEKTLTQIAADANDLYDKAKNKKIQPAEFTGNTFTISNLGMMGIDEFTAIINPPDACILAVGNTIPTPIVNEGGAVVVKNIMKLSLSCDHRVVDGVVGANFLKTLKGYLENPISMLV
jgi:pyruvate dehydrogenase E2 component (dihydrolipoamide acetyltransferase)